MNGKSKASKSLTCEARMPEFRSTNSIVPPCSADTLAASPPSVPPGKTLTLSLPPLLAATSSENFVAPCSSGWPLGFCSASLKLRVIPNAINIDWVKALGANPTPLAFPELYAALEQKAIDGQENPLSVIQANKFYEVQKYLTLTNHQYNPQSLIFSKKVWDTLSPAEKKILEDSALEAAKFQRQVNRDAAAGQLDALKKAGMQVTELSAAEQAKLRDKLKPVIEKHGAAIQATVNELQAELAKLRK